jgi:hypothetical protein
MQLLTSVVMGPRVRGDDNWKIYPPAQTSST